MRIFLKIIIFLIFLGHAEANNNIKFIDINYIVNNSISGKKLNQLIESKNKKIKSDLKDLSKTLEKKKNKIIAQKNILK